jgi:hypothetical protein
VTVLADIGGLCRSAIMLTVAGRRGRLQGGELSCGGLEGVEGGDEGVELGSDGLGGGN